MECPNCKVTLLITERKNVEIDYCPKCRGVWLDKGELDKIIAFSIGSEAQASTNYRDVHPINNRTDGGWKKYDDDDDDYKKYQNSGKPYQKKKSSFLGDLFDF